MVWPWGSVCGADLTPPKSLRNAELCHTNPSVVSLCTLLPAPVAWGAGARHWQPGSRESGKPCASLAEIPELRKRHLLPLRLPGQQQLSKPVPCCGMDGLFLPVQGMLLSQCWGHRRCPKGQSGVCWRGERDGHD